MQCPVDDDAGRRWEQAMRRGDLAAAWATSDTVLAHRDRNHRDDATLPYHRRWVWDGRSFDGADTLVRCYHGLGDTVQFARYLPALQARSAALTLEVQPELCELLAARSDGFRLVPFRPEHPAAPADCDLEIMELAHALAIDPRALPPPYLSVPADRLRAAMALLDGAQRPRIGLCWRSGGWKPDRSLPLQRLLTAAGAACGTLVNLQLDATAEERASGMFAGDGACPPEIAATAALIAAVDVVVSVDTLVAHLAGALGRPLCVLLASEADWRWPDAGTAGLWYPHARLYRQREAGNWAHPLRDLASDLRRHFSRAVAD